MVPPDMPAAAGMTEAGPKHLAEHSQALLAAQVAEAKYLLAAELALGLRTAFEEQDLAVVHHH